MVRRTKQEAQATRCNILDAAERVFEQHGVSGSSLNDIAKAAGLTRGAIYWHFEGKADLFNAMMDRVTLPLEETGNACDFRRAGVSLTRLRSGLVSLLQQVVDDPQVKRVFGIAIHKVEYVGEMHAVRERHLKSRNAALGDIEKVLRLAIRRGELARVMPLRAAAIGLHALLDGLLQNWILDPTGFDLVRVGRQAIDAYLGGFAIAAADTGDRLVRAG